MPRTRASPRPVCTATPQESYPRYSSRCKPCISKPTMYKRVQEVFEAAYRDVERTFGEVFQRLFPGGEGKLLLTEPGNWLETGVDVEARPAGKKVKRLSLLSGGERSLVAVSPVAPHISEEIWRRLGHENSLAHEDFPRMSDESLLAAEAVTCVVQVKGKVRDRLEVDPAIDPAELEKLALAAPGVVRTLDGRGMCAR